MKDKCYLHYFSNYIIITIIIIIIITAKKCLKRYYQVIDQFLYFCNEIINSVTTINFCKRIRSYTKYFALYE